MQCNVVTMHDMTLYGTFHIWKRMCKTGGVKVSGGVRRIKRFELSYQLFGSCLPMNPQEVTMAYSQQQSPGREVKIIIMTGNHNSLG